MAGRRNGGRVAVIPPFAGGLLPAGRFGATLSEVEARFVADPDFAASATRAAVWADWQRTTAMVRSLLPICAAWLGGSFLTDKTDPDDLDVVYVIDDRLLAPARLDPARAPALGLLSRGGLLRSLTGLRVDTFVLNWVPDPEGQRLPVAFTGSAASRILGRPVATQ